MSETREAEWSSIVRRCARQQKKISELNELIEVVADEWKNLDLTCACDATKQQACSICEIGFRLKEWREDRDAEGSQE